MINLPPTPSPKDLYKAYAEGYIGCFLDDPQLPSQARFMARYERKKALESSSLPHVEDGLDLIRAGNPGGEGQCAFPWHLYVKLDEMEAQGRAMKGNQLTGDCTSWGAGCAIDIERATSILEGGEFESYKAQRCTATIYGWRGHSGQGMAVSTAARAVNQYGMGVEDMYVGGKYDLRNYADYVKLGMSWGGRGTPTDLQAVTKENRVKTVSSVQEMEAVMDLLQNGYGLAVGSMLGVADSGNPISRRSGSWSHCMCIVGYEGRREILDQIGQTKPVFLWDNSWGKWNSTTNIPAEWQPWSEGMFCLSWDDTWWAIKNGDNWVFSDFEGFPIRKIKWLMI